MIPAEAPRSAPQPRVLPIDPSGQSGDTWTRVQSLELLRQTAAGRLIHTEGAMPAVTPTCFVLDTDGAVVVPLPADSGLATSLEDVVVGFQVDRLDEQTLQGWSVLVIGRSHLLTDPARLADLRQDGPQPWGHQPVGSYLRIESELVTGTPLGF